MKDYFNYYIAGIIWCVNLVFAVWYIFPRMSINKWFLHVCENADITATLIGGVLIIIVPYVIGFTLMPLGECVRELWQGGKERKCRPDPIKGLLYLEDSGPPFGGRQLAEKETARILCLAKGLFKYEVKDENRYLYFRTIRAYVEENGGNAAELARRAKDLANLTESLLLPVPVCIFFTGIRIMNPTISVHHAYPLPNLLIDVLFFGVLAFIIHKLLVNRYFRLEEYWTRHVYRAFLVLRARDEL